MLPHSGRGGWMPAPREGRADPMATTAAAVDAGEGGGPLRDGAPRRGEGRAKAPPRRPAPVEGRDNGGDAQHAGPEDARQREPRDDGGDGQEDVGGPHEDVLD